MNIQPFPSSSSRPRSSSSSRSLPTYPTPQIPLPIYSSRHRPATARTLRSSPLAGPLPVDESTEDGQKPKYRPSRISSALDPAAVTAARSRYSSLSLADNLGSGSPYSLESLSEDSMKSAASSQLRSTTSFTSTSSTSVRSTPKSDNPLPLPSPRIKNLEPPVMPNNPARRPPSVSRDPRENWLSATDPVPRFSRLGLGGEGVVMPTSAKSRSQSRRRKTTIPSSPNSTAPWLCKQSSKSSPCIRAADSDFGVLGRDEKRISIVQADERPVDHEMPSKRGFIMLVTSLVKKDPSLSMKKAKKQSFAGYDDDDMARHTGRLVDQKMIGGFWRTRWNDVVASIRH